jgi:hypothetical protein
LSADWISVKAPVAVSTNVPMPMIEESIPVA